MAALGSEAARSLGETRAAAAAVIEQMIDALLLRPIDGEGPVVVVLADDPVAGLVDGGPEVVAVAGPVRGIEVPMRKVEQAAELRAGAGVVEIADPIRDAVAKLVKFRDAVTPQPGWREAYQAGLAAFEKRLQN